MRCQSVSLPANVPSYILETDVGNPGIQNKSTVSCEVCGNILPNEKALETHIQTNHGQVNVSNFFFLLYLLLFIQCTLVEPNLELESSSAPAQVISICNSVFFHFFCQCSFLQCNNLRYLWEDFIQQNECGQTYEKIPGKVRSNILVTIQFSFMFLFC